MNEIASQMLKSFERMSCGALFMDGAGLVLATNPTADQLLHTYARTGTLTAGPAKPAALKALLSRAGSRRETDRESWITVPNGDGARLVVHTIPIAAAAPEGAHTLLILVDLSRRPKPSAAALQKLFELTPAESRLANEIMVGKTLSEISEETGLSSATLRTQLSSIFTKTQTRRQPELVALLSRVAMLP